MSETSYIDILPTEAAALLKVSELRNAGYEKEDIFIVKKYQDSIVVEHGLKEDIDVGNRIEDQFPEFIGQEKAFRKALREMRFQNEEAVHIYQQVRAGNILVFVRR